MILKALITVIFVGTAALKLSGKVAADWERWGFPRPFMFGTAIAELVGLALLWWPGFAFAGAAALGLVLLGALATLIRHQEGLSHTAFTALTFCLVMMQLYRSAVV
jgi:hypothetical protein